MREVQKKFDKGLFDQERLERIEALRKVLYQFSLIPKNDRDLIADALSVHAALIRLLKEGSK